MGVAIVAVLRLPLSAVVLATLLTSHAGPKVEPLIIVGVVVAYVVTLVMTRPPALGACIHIPVYPCARAELGCLTLGLDGGRGCRPRLVACARRRISLRVLGVERGRRPYPVSPRPTIRSSSPWGCDESTIGPVISVLPSWAESVIPLRPDESRSPNSPSTATR